jgi:hypothetical protein
MEVDRGEEGTPLSDMGLGWTGVFIVELGESDLGIGFGRVSEGVLGLIPRSHIERGQSLRYLRLPLEHLRFHFRIALILELKRIRAQGISSQHTRLGVCLHTGDSNGVPQVTVGSGIGVGWLSLAKLVPASGKFVLELRYLVFVDGLPGLPIPLEVTFIRAILVFLFYISGLLFGVQGYSGIRERRMKV